MIVARAAMKLAMTNIGFHFVEGERIETGGYPRD
jgi:hypothetical protein